MGEPALKLHAFVSVPEYLEGELISEIRHEYVDGKVMAMAGASDVHEEIAADLFTDLRIHLEGKPCRAYKSDVKLRVQINRKDAFYYPDIMVACDPRDNHRYYREHPTVLIEILSEDEDRDLIHKYLIYRTINSLEEYIVLSQDPKNPKAYVHRRSQQWEQEIVEADGELKLESLGFSSPLQRLYRGALAL